MYSNGVILSIGDKEYHILWPNFILDLIIVTTYMHNFPKRAYYKLVVPYVSSNVAYTAVLDKQPIQRKT